MGRGLLGFIIHGRSFRKDFRNQIKTLVVVGAGFTIAFTWRQTLFDISQKIVQFITNIKSSAVLSLATSIFTTLISVAFVLLVVYLLKEQPDGY
jgi:ABC-type proline/glycine betaine transport system permease subunit